MIAAGAVATAVYLVTLLAVLEVWATHRRHSTEPWGWTGFRTRPDVPVTSLTGAGFMIAVLAGLAAAVLSWVGVLPTVQAGGAARVLGLVCAAAGLTLGLSARNALSRHRRMDKLTELTEPVSWLTTGLFARCRNPLFSALILTQLGATIIAPTWLSMLALAVLVVVCQVQIRHVEEPYLIRTHGQAYQDYAQHTGRFIPGVGQRLAIRQAQ